MALILSNNKFFTASSIRCCILGVFFGLLFEGCRSNTDIKFERGDLFRIFIKAQKEKKKVFVLITDSTCNSCNSFLNGLNRQYSTKRILARDYICYLADINNKKEREIAKMVKCPSFPFPYFFSSDGSLDAFGFPEGKEFDISNLQKISFDKHLFAELFELPISLSQYKDLVSLNLKAALLSLSDSGRPNAYKLTIKSLEIAAYPYNIRNAVNLMPDKLREYERLKAFKYSPSAADEMLYGSNLLDSLFSLNIIADEDSKMKLDYGIDPKSKDIGLLKLGEIITFDFFILNQGTENIEISEISHPCTCVSFQYSTKILRQNEKLRVKVSFRPFEIGAFNKLIYIHTNSKSQPMTTFSFFGMTKK